MSSPTVLAEVIRDAGQSFRMRGEMTMLRESGVMSSGLAANLAGIYLNREAREMFDQRLDATFTSGDADFSPEEVIIGAGFHAAVYCASRVAMGKPRPLVIERTRAGGNFAMSKSPTFFLNSRNRPGNNGLPRDQRGLNYLPGAPVQCSDLSADKFQTNADMAYVIRCTLAMFADVIPGTVTNVYNDDSAGYRPTVQLDSGQTISASRHLLDARGCGDPTAVTRDTVLSFPQFMARMDTPLPLRGVQRVAVIGDGNSALCAAESLLGVGPRAVMSPASAGYLTAVDLYAPGLPASRETWRATLRGRYQGLGSYIRQSDRPAERLTIFTTRGSVTPSLDGPIVNSRGYDLVVMATGNRLTDIGLDQLTCPLIGGETTIARRYGDGGSNIYGIGPAAQIPWSIAEVDAGANQPDESRVGMFRLAGRTSALALTIDSL